ncbi:MAG: glycosyltransferase family 39 protein [Nitrospirae bacterium]|nr:glycosyltransferase family 39 protein [Nitrospirota bacterium]
MQRLLEKPVVLIILLASVLRFWGIWHGYPHSYYPDEQHLVNRALAFGSGDLNPHWFHKPAFLMYTLFFEYGIFYFIGKIIGMFPSVDSFAIYYFNNSWPFILIGRITVTLFGIATVYVVYKTGERFWSRRAAVISSLFLALSYAHVFCGQDVKEDVPTAFFTVLSLYYLMKVLSEGYKTRDYALTGLFAGLGAATKYYSIVMLVPVLMVCIYEAFRDKKPGHLLKYLYSSIAFWGIYFIASPYNFLDPLGRQATFGSIVAMWNKLSLFRLNVFSPVQGGEGVKLTGSDKIMAYGHSLIDYFRVFFSREGAGLVVGTIFILSVMLLMRKSSFRRMVLLSFPVLFSAISIVLFPSYTEQRHQMPLYPFFALITGIVFAEISGMLRRGWILDLTVTALLVFPMTSITGNNIFVSKPDVRTVAKNWVETHIPPSTKIMVDDSCVPLRMNRKNYEMLIERSKAFGAGQFTTHLEKYYSYQMMAAGGVTYDIKEIRHIWWRSREIAGGETYALSEFDREMANPVKEVGINNYDYYAAEGYKYVITSEEIYKLFFMRGGDRAVNFPSYKKFYDDLFARGTLIKEFNASDMDLPGPTIKIFRIS